MDALRGIFEINQPEQEQDVQGTEVDSTANVGKYEVETGVKNKNKIPLIYKFLLVVALLFLFVKRKTVNKIFKK